MEAWGSYIFSKQQIKAALIQVIVQVCLTLKLAETTMLYWQLGKLVCLLLESHVDRKQRQLGIYGVPRESHLWEKRFKKSLIFLRSYKMIAVMLQMWIISQGRLVSANVKLFWENGLNVDVSVLAVWEKVPKTLVRKVWSLSKILGHTLVLTQGSTHFRLYLNKHLVQCFRYALSEAWL